MGFVLKMGPALEEQLLRIICHVLVTKEDHINFTILLQSLLALLEECDEVDRSFGHVFLLSFPIVEFPLPPSTSPDVVIIIILMHSSYIKIPLPVQSSKSTHVHIRVIQKK